MNLSILELYGELYVRNTVRAASCYLTIMKSHVKYTYVKLWRKKQTSFEGEQNMAVIISLELLEIYRFNGFRPKIKIVDFLLWGDSACSYGFINATEELNVSWWDLQKNAMQNFVVFILIFINEFFKIRLNTSMTNLLKLQVPLFNIMFADTKVLILSTIWCIRYWTSVVYKLIISLSLDTSNFIRSSTNQENPRYIVPVYKNMEWLVISNTLMSIVAYNLIEEKSRISK